jgi:hypothetical protein
MPSLVNPRFAVRAHPLLVAALLAGLACAAAAQVPDKSRPGAAAKGGPRDANRILTPAQLRTCVNQKEALQRQTQTALAAKAQVDAERADLERLESELAVEIGTVDRTSGEAVNAFNAKVGRRDQLLEANRARMTAFNAQAQDVQAAKSAYEKSCENRRYDERDLEDIQRKK